VVGVNACNQHGMLDQRMPYKVLLIDLDGVLRRWSPTDRDIEQACGLPPGVIRAIAFEHSLLNEAITGRISDEIWRERVGALLAQNYPQAQASEAVAAWSTPIGEVNLDVLRIVRRAAKHLRTVLVTNATTRLNRDLESLGLKDSLDVVVNSSEIGVAKPESDFYIAALRAANVSAAETLYADDSRANVDAATKLGIHAHHFKGHEALTSFLAQHRIIDG
jgi:putative hydrolase of the HAD superfamily